MVVADDLLIDKTKPKPGIFPDEADYINTSDQNREEGKTSDESFRSGETSTSGESRQPTSSLDDTTTSLQSSLELQTQLADNGKPPARPPKPIGIIIGRGSAEKDADQNELAVREVECKLRSMKPLPDPPRIESKFSPDDAYEGLDYNLPCYEEPNHEGFMNQIYTESGKSEKSKETQKPKKSDSTRKSVFNKLSQIVKNSSPRRSPTGSVHDKTNAPSFVKRFIPPSKTENTPQFVEDFRVSSSTTVSDIQDISSDNTDHGATSNTEASTKAKHEGDNRKPEGKNPTLTQSLRGHASFLRSFSAAQSNMVSKDPPQRPPSPASFRTKSSTNVLGTKRAFGGGGGGGRFWPSTKSPNRTQSYACAIYVDNNAAPDIVLSAKGTFIRSHKLPAEIICKSADEPQSTTHSSASPAREMDPLNLKEAGLIDLREGEKLYVYGVYMEPRLLVKNVLGEYGLARLSEVKDAEIYWNQLKGEDMPSGEEPAVS
ncbi:unnamed protein product [Calicophoron daubneyi]|uniref:Uncharacterized protein n=1 Tax=Calicophoron daubneyi TaxID=300641 RepID=A0AAV2TZA9_CALDB